MKIFITGGTGFIGRNFINIVPNEIEIFATTRNKNNSSIKLNRSVNWVHKELDCVNYKDLKGMDAVVHFASAGVSPQKASWDQLYYWNVNCTLLLLRAAAEAGVRRVLISGSFIEYGLSANQYDYIPTSAALLPTTPYASSKAAAFELAYAFCLEEKISLFYNRIFSAYGEGQFEKNLWPSLRKAAINGEDFHMSSGMQIRDFISVKDVGNTFLQDLILDTANDFKPKIKNVCSGKGTSVLEFASYWWNKWNAKGNLIPNKLLDRKDEPVRFVGSL